MLTDRPRPQVEAKYATDTWQRQAYEALGAKLTAKDRMFPCIYGTRGYKANELSFLFLDSEYLPDPRNVEASAKALLSYHDQALKLGKNTSLIILTPPPNQDRSVDNYHTEFWAYLKGLRKLDPKPSMDEVPEDTNAQFWCFHFDGIPAFFGVLTPAHKQRLSRQSNNLCLVYQPRYLFDALFSSEANRASATKTVRGLVDKYDFLPRSPDISDYGEAGKTESRQYFLLDENEPAICPYPTLNEV